MRTTHDARLMRSYRRARVLEAVLCGLAFVLLIAIVLNTCGVRPQ